MGKKIFASLIIFLGILFACSITCAAKADEIGDGIGLANRPIGYGNPSFKTNAQAVSLQGLSPAAPEQPVKPGIKDMGNGNFVYDPSAGPIAAPSRDISAADNPMPGNLPPGIAKKEETPGQGLHRGWGQGNGFGRNAPSDVQSQLKQKFSEYMQLRVQSAGDWSAIFDKQTEIVDALINVIRESNLPAGIKERMIQRFERQKEQIEHMKEITLSQPRSKSGPKNGIIDMGDGRYAVVAQ